MNSNLCVIVSRSKLHILEHRLIQKMKFKKLRNTLKINENKYMPNMHNTHQKQTLVTMTKLTTEILVRRYLTLFFFYNFLWFKHIWRHNSFAILQTILFPKYIFRYYKVRIKFNSFSFKTIFNCVKIIAHYLYISKQSRYTQNKHIILQGK